MKIEALLQKYDCDLNTPVEDIPEEAIDEILNGSNEQLRIPAEKIHTTNDFYTDFEGLARYMEQTAQREDSASARKWVEQFATKKVCPVCHGSRLNKEALCYKNKWEEYPRAFFYGYKGTREMDVNCGGKSF